MDKIADIDRAYTNFGNSERGAELVLALALGWGLSQIGKGLFRIGDSIAEIASTARHGYFRS